MGGCASTSPLAAQPHIIPMGPGLSAFERRPLLCRLVGLLIIKTSISHERLRIRTSDPARSNRNQKLSGNRPVVDLESSSFLLFFSSFSPFFPPFSPSFPLFPSSFSPLLPPSSSTRYRRHDHPTAAINGKGVAIPLTIEILPFLQSVSLTVCLCSIMLKKPPFPRLCLS